MKKICLLICTIFIITSCSSIKETSNTFKYDNNSFIFEDTINAKDIIKNEDYDIDNITLDTTKVGNNNVYIFYTKNGKNYKELLSYDVKDITEPLIWISKSYTYTLGSEDNLLDRILCADNYDKKPNCYIEGDYDFNTLGTYNLKYIAIDSSNNKEEANFTLNIIKEFETNNNNIETDKILFSDIVNNYKTDDTMIGIDVSKWQGDIDWKKVKDAGCEFAIIRIGYQPDFDEDYELDPMFKQNIENALANDIKVGIYFYSYATDSKEAIKEAKWVIKNIKDYDITMPIAFDWENYNYWNSLNISLYDLRQTSNAFLKTIKDNGYIPAMYGSKLYLNSFWSPIIYDTWVALYADNNTYDQKYIMWQLANTGQIDGINGDVDIDIYYK